jgi:DNA-binding transcriptional ArsR family regulator
MKPLYVQAAEERLKGQPKRHAKVYKDDISVFEGDMIYVRNHLLRNGTQSLSQIADATGIPKSTIQKLLSPKGIKRVYNQGQLEIMRDRNSKRYRKILSEHTGVARDKRGKWKGLIFRESDRDRFAEWLFVQGYILVGGYNKRGEPGYRIVEVPEYIEEEISTLYTHRIMK